MMNTLYHYLGLTVFWNATAATGIVAAWSAWEYGIGKLPPWPWLVWPIFYAQRALGCHRKSQSYLTPPFYFNREDNRAYTKQHMVIQRTMQASVIRYNRRRWATSAPR